MADLLEIENWEECGAPREDPLGIFPPEPTDLLACHVCLCIRPATKFINPQKSYDSCTSEPGKFGVDISNIRQGRFCIPCGIRYELYYD